MSLVNDMLRDLEDRQDSNGQKVAGVSPVFAQRDSPFSQGAKRALATGGVLMLAALSVWGWQTNWWQPAAPVEATAAQPVVVQRKEALISVIPAQAGVRDSLENIDSRLRGNDRKRLDQSPLSQQEDIHNLLAKAEQALIKTRLTTPIDDNALGYYRAILALHPGHPEALQGLQKIANRYRDWASAAHHEGEHTQAQAHLQRALLVQPGDTELLALQQQFNNASQPKPVSPPEPVQTIAPSASSLDRQAAETARRLLNDGHNARARNLLDNYLAGHPDGPQSTQMLAELHLKNGDVKALQRLLANTDALRASQVATLQARLKIADQDLAGARALLEQNPPSVNSDPAYHALLAGVYHKSGQHRQAAALYRTLVTVEPAFSRHWLGLAVALDALKDNGALQAFQKARAGNNNPDVQHYIDQRIAALSGKASN